MTRAEQIYRDFEQFDMNNPEVWELFRKIRADDYSTGFHALRRFSSL
jgi:hypothetical protein